MPEPIEIVVNTAYKPNGMKEALAAQDALQKSLKDTAAQADRMSKAQATLAKYNEVTGMSMRALPSEAKAVLDSMRLYDKLPGSIDQTNKFLGMNRREFGRTGSEAVFALELIGGKATEANAALGGGVRAATELGRAFAFGSGVGVAVTAIALALGGVMTALDRTTPEMKAFGKTIDDLAKGDESVRGLAQLAGVTDEEAKQALEAAKQSKSFAGELKGLKDAAEKANDPLSKLKDTAQQLGDTFARPDIQKGIEDALVRTLQTTNPLIALLIPKMREWATKTDDSSAAQNKLAGAVKNNAAALLAHNKELDFLKGNLSGAAKEAESYGTAMNKLAADHQKAKAAFEADAIDADKKAAADRIKIDVDTGHSIGKVYDDLARHMGDAAEDAASRAAQAEHDWLRQAEGFARDRSKIETDLADEQTKIASDRADKIAGIERDLADQLEGISRDTADKESSAKTWAEVQRIRKDAQAREQEAQKKARQSEDEVKKDAQARETEAQKKARQAREELTLKQTLALEDHNYREGLANAESIKSAQRARRDADIQAEEIRRTAREQQDAITARLAGEQDAIGKRAQAESAAYTQSKTEATTAHNSRMTELLTYKTEVEMFNAELSVIAAAGYTIPVRYQQEILGNAPSMQQWQQGYRPSGWYASGLDTVVTRPAVIGVGEAGAERVTVTPLSGQNKNSGRSIVFQNCNFRSVDDVYAALDRWDKGLR